MAEEKAVAPHSSLLAWRIPRTEEPGGLQATGSQSRTRLSDEAATEGMLPRWLDGEASVCNAGGLGQEEPLEEGMAPHSSLLAWRIPRTEEPGGLWFMGSQELDTTSATRERSMAESPCSTAEINTTL